MGFTEQCPKSGWCDQGQRPHVRCELTAATVIGEGWTAPGAVTAQLVIHGLDDADAAPMLALVNSSLRQCDVTLEWRDAHKLACAILEQHRAFSRLTAPDG